MDSDLGEAIRVFKNYFSKYDNFVQLNPRVAAEIEAIIRWSSYLIATRKSPLLGELLSSAANILQLCNDLILRNTISQLKLDLSDCATQLRTFLNVLQSLELLAEIYARNTYGAIGKWTIITVIQIVKAAIKLILLLVFDQGISKSNPIVALDRIHFSEICKLQQKFSNEDDACQIQEILPDQNVEQQIVLKSSGRKMRSITGGVSSRVSKLSGAQNVSVRESGIIDKMQKQRLLMLLNRYRDHTSAKLGQRQILGEILHISRPIAHLALMGTFGTQSWIAYLTSILMDLSSLHLVRSPLPLADSRQTIPKEFQFNMSERMELGQRASSLLLYLLRSPFFDEYTKQKALDGLAASADNIPLVGSFLAAFFNYIPDWQKDYFRVWSE